MRQVLAGVFWGRLLCLLLLLGAGFVQASADKTAFVNILPGIVSDASLVPAQAEKLSKAGGITTRSNRNVKPPPRYGVDDGVDTTADKKRLRKLKSKQVTKRKRKTEHAASSESNAGGQVIPVHTALTTPAVSDGIFLSTEPSPVEQHVWNVGSEVVVPNSEISIAEEENYQESDKALAEKQKTRDVVTEKVAELPPKGVTLVTPNTSEKENDQESDEALEGSEKQKTSDVVTEEVAELPPKTLVVPTDTSEKENDREGDEALEGSEKQKTSDVVTEEVAELSPKTLVVPTNTSEKENNQEGDEALEGSEKQKTNDAVTEAFAESPPKGMTPDKGSVGQYEDDDHVDKNTRDINAVVPPAHQLEEEGSSGTEDFKVQYKLSDGSTVGATTWHVTTDGSGRIFSDTVPLTLSDDVEQKMYVVLNRESYIDALRKTTEIVHLNVYVIPVSEKAGENQEGFKRLSLQFTIDANDYKRRKEFEKFRKKLALMPDEVLERVDRSPYPAALKKLYIALEEYQFLKVLEVATGEENEFSFIAGAKESHRVDEDEELSLEYYQKVFGQRLRNNGVSSFLKYLGYSSNNFDDALWKALQEKGMQHWPGRDFLIKSLQGHFIPDTGDTSKNVGINHALSILGSLPANIESSSPLLLTDMDASGKSYQTGIYVVIDFKALGRWLTKRLVQVASAKADASIQTVSLTFEQLMGLDDEDSFIRFVSQGNDNSTWIFQKGGWEDVVRTVAGAPDLLPEEEVIEADSSNLVDNNSPELDDSNKQVVADVTSESATSDRQDALKFEGDSTEDNNQASPKSAVAVTDHQSFQSQDGSDVKTDSGQYVVKVTGESGDHTHDLINQVLLHDDKSDPNPSTEPQVSMWNPGNWTLNPLKWSVNWKPWKWNVNWRKIATLGFGG